MTTHKARGNAHKRTVTADDGIVWECNRYGVVYRHEPDPHFPGWQIMVSADYQTTSAIHSHLWNTEGWKPRP